MERPAYVPGEVLVKFKEGASPEQVGSVKSALGLSTLKVFKRIGVHHLKGLSGVSAEELVQRLRAEAVVEYAELNHLRYANLTPNDTRYPEMWGLNNTGQTGGTVDADVDAPQAWDLQTGSSALVVADIDSGMDLAHEDLMANLWTNPGEIPFNGVDDDGNGFIDDLHGWDFRDNDNDPSDTSFFCGGHGTHTAGTIGAVGNNGVGVTGVNWQIQIMPLRVFGGFFCSGSDADIISAIEYYTDLGVRFSNNSYGGGGFNQALMDAIRASNSVFVAAAGNGGFDGIGDNNDVTPEYPASYDLDNIIAVAATDHNDLLATFSNYGPTSVDLGAPGVDILSTTPGNTYSLLSGTSMSTPHVTGAVGLLMAQDPTLTVNEVKWRVLEGVDPKGYPVLSGGRLNLFNSLSLPPPSVVVDVNPIGSTVLMPGGSFSYEVSVTNTAAVAQTATVKVVFRIPDGREFTLKGPVNVTLSAGQNRGGSFSQTIPATAPLGDYTLIGSAEVSGTSFDEDTVAYTVVP
jgi:subtilisin family serine protease